MAASSTLVEIAAFLAAGRPDLVPAIAGISGVIATAKAPASPDVATTVYEYPGAPDEKGFGVPGTQHEHPRIQVVCRAAEEDYEAARLQAEKVRQLLATVQARTLSGTKYLLISPLGAPFPLGDDTSRRPRIACNFQVDKEPSRTA